MVIKKTIAALGVIITPWLLGSLHFLVPKLTMILLSLVFVAGTVGGTSISIFAFFPNEIAVVGGLVIAMFASFGLDPQVAVRLAL